MARVLVTGGAGFIGSHICDRLIKDGYEVICYDNLLTGYKGNIQHLLNNQNFEFVNGDIRDKKLLSANMELCSHVTHQAALGSVPRSVKDPITTNDINIQGSLNVLNEAKNNSIEKLVYASSSSVYGDNLDMPKIENNTGRVLSPYAVTKSTIEDYSRVFNDTYGLKTIGLRYFNVFGPRQSPEGAYAAVIPVFMEAIKNNQPPIIYGDGKQTRDFSYVRNIVNANMSSLFDDSPKAYGNAYNVACGETLSINELFLMIKQIMTEMTGTKYNIEPKYGEKREGDIRDSLADLNNIRRDLNYAPETYVAEGMRETIQWFLSL